MGSSFRRLHLAAVLVLFTICLPTLTHGTQKKHGSFIPPRSEEGGRSDIVLLSSTHPILIDYSKGVMASRNYSNRKCTIRNLKKENDDDNTWQPRREKKHERTFIVGQNITKFEVSKISGMTILNFCRGLNIYLILTSAKKDSDWVEMLHDNLIPDERFQEKHDYNRKPTQEDLLLRRKREAGFYERQPGKKRYRGQTQTQFIAFDKEGSNGTNKGIAEAVAQPDLSRATVSGTNGMGQAQSQSGSGDDCDECYPYGLLGGKFPVGPDGRIGYPGATGPTGVPSTYPGAPGQVIGPGTSVGYPGVPGRFPQGVPTYPGAPSIPGQVISTIPGQTVSYPGGVLPGTPGERPGTVGSIPGTGYPGVSTPGYPGVIGVPGVGYPGETGIGVPGAYPGIPGQTPGAGV